MYLTRLGLAYLGAVAMTLFAAASSGNNLLYLLFSILSGAGLSSLVWGRLNLARVRVELTFPEQVFAGQPFALGAVVSNPGRLPAWQVQLSLGEQTAFIGRLGPLGRFRWTPRLVLPHRGRNRVGGFFLESRFPLGLVRHRVPLELEGLALPPTGEYRGGSAVEAQGPSGGTSPLKGVGEELFGIREYNESDDARLLNWKLTAKTGRPVVNEFAQRSGQRVDLRVEADERLIREAASAARFHIDAGAEVNLSTPEGETGFGRGLLHLDRLLRALALLGDGKTLRAAGRDEEAEGPPAFEPNPDSIRYFYLATSAVWVSLFQVEDFDPRWVAALSLAFPAGLWLDRRPHRRIPEAIWTPLSTLMLLYAVFVGWRLFGVTISTAHTMGYVMLHRLLSRKGPRELGQAFAIAFLGFFLVTGLSVSIWYPATFLAFVWLAGCWLMASSGGGTAWRPALAALLAASVPAALALFAFVPRVETRGLAEGLGVEALDHLRMTGSSVVGFSDDVSLGWYGELKKGSARAMRVRVPAGSSGRPIYVRGAALEVFDGAGWSKLPREFVYRQSGKTRRTLGGRAWVVRENRRLVFPEPAAPPETGLRPEAPPGTGLSRHRISPGSSGFEAELFVYPQPSRVAFTLGRVLSIETREGSAYFDFTDTVYFPTPSVEGRRYVLSALDDEPGFSENVVEFDRFLRGAYLAVPRPAEKLRYLAEEIVRGDATALDKARSIETYLRSRYDYSLFSTGPKSLEAFLFESKDGNCEYFATAGAVLLRHLGIPTRLVTGFLASEWNAYGSFYDVRQSDAHAWLEAYIEGRGWVTIDPTPSSGFWPERLSSYGRLAERWLDAARLRWYRDIVGFDTFVQRNAWQGLSSWLGSLGLAATWLLGGAALLAAGVKLGRLAIPARASVRSSDEFYRRMLDRLERAGLVREAWQTGREFAASVGGARPDWRRPVEAITELHYRARYAGLEPGPDERPAIEEALESLRG